MKRKKINDLTPKSLKCFIGACPALFQDRKTGELYIRGKQINSNKFDFPLEGKEAIVKVPKELFQKLLKK